LFEFAKVKNNSLIDEVKSYIDKGYIKKVWLETEYKGGIVDIYKIYPFLKKYNSYQFALKGYITKTNNFVAWSVLKEAETLDDFISKLKEKAVAEFGKEKGMWLVNRCIYIIKTNKLNSLKEFIDIFYVPL